MSIGLLLFLLGLLMAIPLSVIANLLTPRIRDHFERQSKAKSKRQADQLLAQLNRIQAYEGKPLEWLILCQRRSMSLLFLGMVTTASSGICFATAALLGQQPLRAFIGAMLYSWLRGAVSSLGWGCILGGFWFGITFVWEFIGDTDNYRSIGALKKKLQALTEEGDPLPPLP